MQNINQLFNQIFKTSNENYVSGNEAITNCRKKFLALKDDKITTKVLLYFFPVHPKCEKNNNEFWFCQYKNDNEYDEYDFAEDLLKNYVEYLFDKNEENFETSLRHILLKFENYKMFTLYIYNIQGYTDNLMSTIAYFTKDPSYHLNNLNAYVSSESIQTKEFIDNLKEIVEKKIIYYDKLGEIHELKEQVNNKNKQEENYQKKILELSEELLNRGKKMTTFLEDKIKQDSKIIALQEDKIKQDSKIIALQKDKIKQNSKIIALQQEKDSQIQALQEEINSQIQVLQEGQKNIDSQLKNIKDDDSKKEVRLKVLEDDNKKSTLQIKNLICCGE